jgi:hypothetical protein
MAGLLISSCVDFVVSVSRLRRFRRVRRLCRVCRTRRVGPWGEGVFEKAAATGNRDILWWLRLEGCAWKARTFFSAINGDADLLTLKWLRHEKCPLGVKVFAALQGHFYSQPNRHDNKQILRTRPPLPKLLSCSITSCRLRSLRSKFP